MCIFTNQIDVAQIVEPEVVGGGGGEREVVLLEAALTRLHGVGETTQDPLVHQTARATSLHAHNRTHTHTMAATATCT